MKLSTRGRYGVKALCELALHGGNEAMSLKTIADNQGLSEHYLEQLIGPLRKAGLVKSVRGAKGGYVLGKPPSEITVGDIVRVLEGPIAPTECSLGDDTPVQHCGKADGCMARPIWNRLRQSILNVVDSISLADLVEEAKNGNTKSYMYYI